MNYVWPIIFILLLLAFNIYSMQVVFRSDNSLASKIALLVFIWIVPFFGALFPLFSDQPDRIGAQSDSWGGYYPAGNEGHRHCSPSDADCSDSS